MDSFVVTIDAPPPRNREVTYDEFRLLLRAVAESRPSALHLGGSALPGAAR